MALEIDEDVKEFLIEGYEHLNQLESDLVRLEQSQADLEVMNRIYRSLHTIKGNSGFLGLEKLESVTHAGENLLSRLRDRAIAVNPDIITALLQTIDAIRSHFAVLESTGGEEEVADPTALLAWLNRLQEPDAIAEPVAAEKIAEIPVVPSPLTPQASSSPISQLESNKTSVENGREDNNAKSNSDETEVSQPKLADTAIRVDVGLLDTLMNLVGELVLCRNQILEFANTQTANEQNDNTFKSVSGRLNLVTSELQEGVMKTRMQPIRSIWSKFPRVVRDIALSLNKQVRLEMEGEETELDKTLLEAIADPLTHIVRNSLDHGIETPEVRLAKGKPAIGTLRLHAYHESGHVIIEVTDDGGGIDPEKVKQKAVQKGIISPDRAAQLSDRQALELIFLPSFSTAEQVTNLSGRGVGMDVVRTNIEKINGAIDVSARVGRGTVFKLKIPLTLAIIPTLMITTSGDRFAIPQVNLVELVRLEGEQIGAIEMFHGTPVYRLRGKLLPLVYLNRELQLDEETGSGGADDEVLNIVVVQATDRPFGLVVDAIDDTQEIVVKPLGKGLKSISCYAGATILGDGKIALILDVQGIAQRTHILSESHEKALVAEEDRRRTLEEPEQLLLFEACDRRRMAIPLANVCRLEEFPLDTIERVGRYDAIQYRQQIMPLINLSTVFDNEWEGIQNSKFYARNGFSPPHFCDPEDEEKLSVVVVAIDGENQVGLRVKQILDIVEQVIEVKGAATQEGIKYCAVIQGKVTEIIDVEAITQNHSFGRKQLVISH